MDFPGQRQIPEFEIDVGRHLYLEEFGERVRTECTKWYNYVATYLFTSNYNDPPSVLIQFDPFYDGKSAIESTQTFLIMKNGLIMNYEF
jgi:hypothetical protein